MSQADDDDSPWKDVLEHAVPEFMAFYFPDAPRQIDWMCTPARPRATPTRIEQGIEQGFQRGELKGRLEGQVATLARQLGPLSEEIRRRLDAATQEQLDHWTDRVLDARTLAEVFEGH
jgi:hypothetical protein